MNLKLGIINNDNATDYPVQLGAEFVNDLNNQTLIKVFFFCFVEFNLGPLLLFAFKK